MEASQKNKLPLKPKLGYTPTKGTLGICLCRTIGRTPGDRTSHSLDASIMISTCVLRLEASGALRRQTGQTGSPNWSGPFWPGSHARSSASALWFHRVTRWFSGEPPQTRELDVASANHHSWLGSHEGSTLVFGSTKKPSSTSSCRSCHHAARTWPYWPPGPSNQAYLSSPHLEASLATTFRTCSSLAPTPGKPQPAPAILSQELVHITLSITHHTRKRPSTGSWTTHGPQSPPWWVYWQHTHLVIKEKREKKRNDRRNSNKRSKTKQR
jgi:hypothetical protein